MPMISVKVAYEGETRSVTAKTIEEAILQIGISPQTVLAKLNGEFAPDDEPLKDGDRLMLIRISSIG
jgi:sulfur carrier protein ThiS